VPKTKKVIFMITDAGGGHRASAVALQAACAVHAPQLQTSIVNMYRGPWAKAEPLGALTGFYAEDLYNLVLKRSLLGLAGAMRFGALLASHLPNATALRDGLRWLDQEKPDLCVSLMPFVNDLHAQICGQAGVPFALAMTDLVDRAPYMWYTPRAAREAVWVNAPCGTAAAQAQAAGATRVIPSGLLLHPKYHDPALRQLSRQDARLRLGLDPERLTVLVSMGGFGSKAMGELISGLDMVGRDWQIVAICGRNEGLRSVLAGLKLKRHHLVPVGFTQELELYLRAADLMVGKPGPASIFEAIAAGTPMVLDAAMAMPQELPNAELAALHGMAQKVEHRRDLPTQVAALAASASALDCMQAAQRAYPLANAGALLAEALAA
jgi:UDP-N-acetylglucosamine:LPS N-acetylglucosamine transferase